MKQVDAFRPIDESSSGATPFRVLVVDDDADVVEAMVTLLVLLGHQVESCRSGIEAIAAVTRSVPRVVLLDIGMQGMDGLQTARVLRRQEPNPEQMLLVAVSGYGEADIEAQAREAGFDHHLIKPVGREVLARLLDSIR